MLHVRLLKDAVVSKNSRFLMSDTKQISTGKTCEPKYENSSKQTCEPNSEKQTCESKSERSSEPTRNSEKQTKFEKSSESTQNFEPNYGTDAWTENDDFSNNISSRDSW